MAKPSQAEQFQALNRDQKLAAVFAAGSVDELDAMWAAWAERGYSPNGILHMTVLKQRRELGAELTEEEEELIERIEADAAQGAKLKAIRGKFG